MAFRKHLISVPDKTTQLDLASTWKIRPLWVHHQAVLIGKPNDQGSIPVQNTEYFHFVLQSALLNNNTFRVQACLSVFFKSCILSIVH
jgi:hypothetical protein